MRLVARFLLGTLLLAASLPLPAPAAVDRAWPTYGGSYANDRRFASAQITPRTVGSLKLAWKFSTGIYGTFESSPIVVGDTLYFTAGLTNTVFALDPETGALKWRFTPAVGASHFIFQVNRGVAVDGGSVFLATLDDQLIALDARTGAPRWTTRIGDPATGLTETMAPLAWGGLVFIGSSGGEYGVRGSFSAYSQRDGHLVWRWWSVSKGWEGRYVTAVHGYDLHRDVARERALAPKFADAWRHGGGPVWMTPALDVADGTIYLSTGNPSPPDNGDERPGDNLYTDCVVALDGRTGRMRWYYQETPHDLWDYDAASPPVLIDAVDAQGRRVPAVGEAGKTGWFYVLDRRTGRPIRFAPFIPQPHLYAPPTENGTRVEPGSVGGAVAPVAYDPGLHSVFVAGTVLGEVVQKQPPGAWPAGQREWLSGSSSWPDPASALFSRIDVDTGRVVWQHRTAGPIGGGGLSLGDLYFVTETQAGTLDAVDARSGRMLWRVKPADLPDPGGSVTGWIVDAATRGMRIAQRVWDRVRRRPEPASDSDAHAPPVAYTAGGRDFVAVVVDQAYSVKRPNGGGTLYAFSL